MANIITRPIASAAERIAAATYMWGHTGSAPAADRRFAVTDFLMKNASGNVGLGTITPAGKFHVAGATDTLQLLVSGLTKGVRVNTGPIGTTIEGVDATGSASYQPLTIGGSIVNFSISGADKFAVTTGAAYAVNDNTMSLGGPSNRMTALYAVTGSINTSDEREKTWRGGLSDLEYAAGRAIFGELGFYQWTEEVDKKGANGARFHFGARAQHVWTIFATHGLAPKIQKDGTPEKGIIPPALLCYDEWEELTESIEEDVEVEFDEEETVATGKMVKVDGKDYELTEIVTRKAMRTERRETGEKHITVKGGYRYGFRVDQLNSFLIAVIARRQDEQDARIEALIG